MFWDGFNVMTLALNSFTFENCFFGFTSPSGTVYMGDMSDNDYTEYAQLGGTVTFKNCTFYNPNFVASFLFDIRENGANIVFEGVNTFPASATSVWEDNRGALPPYTITNTGSFVFTNTPPLPIFGSPKEGQYAAYEKIIIDDYYWGRGMGYRSGN